MKAKSGDFGKITGRGDPLRLYLFHGPDIAGSRALAARLAGQLGGERIALDPGGLKGDPGRIVDEAAGAGLFADSKHIWVEPVANDFSAAADALLGTASTEFPVIAIAGPLTRSSKLLKAIEPSDAAIAVISYEPSVADVARDVERMLSEHGLIAAEGVTQRLAQACDLNRDILAQEVRKLAIYLGEERQLDHEAIDAVGADYGDTEWMALGDAAMDGDVETVEQALASLSPQATEATLILRALQRRIQQLAPMSARIADGDTVQGVVAAMGRALFWKDKPLVSRLLGKWPAPMLSRLATRVHDADRAMMVGPGAKRAALGEELLAIARIGARQSRR